MTPALTNTRLPKRQPDPAALDREADCLLQQGLHALAEALAHRAAEMRQVLA
jgi:hypothetical protein